MLDDDLHALTPSYCSSHMLLAKYGPDVTLMCGAVLGPRANHRSVAPMRLPTGVSDVRIAPRSWGISALRIGELTT